MLSDRHGPLALLAVPNHEHVGDLSQLGLANLAPDRLTAIVELDAGAVLAQLIRDRGPVLVEAVGYRQHDRLRGSEPERQLPGVVLEHDSNETLVGAEQ